MIRLKRIHQNGGQINDKYKMFKSLLIKTYLIFLAILVVISGCIAKVDKEGDRVCFKNNCFGIEIVSNESDRMKGLQFRKSLEQDKGMLFVFSESHRSVFWMKDTFIPLDIIWIDESRKVVHIEHNVPPCKKDSCPAYSTPYEALYVLEINAGKAEEIGLKEGDLLRFDLK